MPVLPNRRWPWVWPPNQRKTRAIQLCSVQSISQTALKSICLGIDTAQEWMSSSTFNRMSTFPRKIVPVTWRRVVRCRITRLVTSTKTTPIKIASTQVVKSELHSRIKRHLKILALISWWTKMPWALSLLEARQKRVNTPLKYTRIQLWISQLLLTKVLHKVKWSVNYPNSRNFPTKSSRSVFKEPRFWAALDSKLSSKSIKSTPWMRRSRSLQVKILSKCNPPISPLFKILGLQPTRKVRQRHRQFWLRRVWRIKTISWKSNWRCNKIKASKITSNLRLALRRLPSKSIKLHHLTCLLQESRLPVTEEYKVMDKRIFIS